MSHALRTIAALSGILIAGSAAAASPVLWQNNSLSYLYGKTYEVNPPIQQTLTYEHVSGWSVGDLFIFVDGAKYNGQKDSGSGEFGLYGEFSPRFSLSKIFGTEIKSGLVSDVLLATTYEFGEGDVETFLAGPAVDFNLPGFDYFQLNVYKRMPQDGRDGESIQITPVWAITIPFGQSSILFDGFIDWNIKNDGTYHANLHFNPQLKYDLGKAMQLKEKQLYVGVEYSYWKNKYGIKDSPYFDTDQSVTNLLVKYHF